MCHTTPPNQLPHLSHFLHFSHHITKQTNDELKPQTFIHNILTFPTKGIIHNALRTRRALRAPLNKPTLPPEQKKRKRSLDEKKKYAISTNSPRPTRGIVISIKRSTLLMFILQKRDSDSCSFPSRVSSNAQPQRIPIQPDAQTQPLNKLSQDSKQSTAATHPSAPASRRHSPSPHARPAPQAAAVSAQAAARARTGRCCPS